MKLLIKENWKKDIPPFYGKEGSCNRTKAAKSKERDSQE